MSLTEIPHHGLLEELPGQHQLLGWHLSPRAIDFLWMTHVLLDFDEMGILATLLPNAGSGAVRTNGAV